MDWLGNLVRELKKWWTGIRTSLPHAAMVVGDLIVSGADTLAQIVHKLYYKEDDKWYEEKTTRQLPENELPDYIRNKIGFGTESNITPELEQELEMKI